MNKIFIHMDEGWPGFCSTNRGANGGRIYHIRADFNPGGGAPWSLGCCGIEVSLVASDVRISTKTIMYMLSRLRGRNGKDLEGYPLCIWHEDGNAYVRIGQRIIQAEALSDPEERAEFVEWLETHLDNTFPPEAQ